MLMKINGGSYYTKNAISVRRSWIALEFMVSYIFPISAVFLTIVWYYGLDFYRILYLLILLIILITVGLCYLIAVWRYSVPGLCEEDRISIVAIRNKLKHRGLHSAIRAVYRSNYILECIFRYLVPLSSLGFCLLSVKSYMYGFADVYKAIFYIEIYLLVLFLLIVVSNICCIIADRKHKTLNYTNSK